MNLYLLFALALGAISGTADAPAARVPFAAVVAKSGVRAEARERVVAVAIPATSTPRASFASARVFARVDAPLTGAGTPRAPSA